MLGELTRIDVPSPKSIIMYIDLTAIPGFGMSLFLGIVLVHIEGHVLK